MPQRQWREATAWISRPGKRDLRKVALTPGQHKVLHAGTALTVQIVDAVTKVPLRCAGPTPSGTPGGGGGGSGSPGPSTPAGSVSASASNGAGTGGQVAGGGLPVTGGRLALIGAVGAALPVAGGRWRTVRRRPPPSRSVRHGGPPVEHRVARRPAEVVARRVRRPSAAGRGRRRAGRA